MKTMPVLMTALALLALLTAPARADDATAPNAAAARETFQNMSPEEKQATKEQMRAQMQAKRAAWQQLSPEEKDAKRAAMRTKMQQRRAQFAAGHTRPFGSTTR
jgi:FixJ family two-component response regulator